MALSGFRTRGHANGVQELLLCDLGGQSKLAQVAFSELLKQDGMGSRLPSLMRFSGPVLSSLQKLSDWVFLPDSVPWSP